LGVPYFTSLDRFFDIARPDAVSVVVPTVKHYEVARQALERGLHVLIEKPVTTTVLEAEDLLKLAAGKNLVLQVGHIERFNSAVQYLSNVVREPIFLQSNRLGPFSNAFQMSAWSGLMIHGHRHHAFPCAADIVNINAMGKVHPFRSRGRGFRPDRVLQRDNGRTSRQPGFGKKDAGSGNHGTERYLTIDTGPGSLDPPLPENQQGSGLVEVIRTSGLPEA
jgi:hypothetical protein